MKQAELRISVQQPEIADYEELYPRVRCNTPQKITLFNLITKPENIYSALKIVEETGNSPVTVLESKLLDSIENGGLEPLSSHEKQFVGTVMAMVMESNGWVKTNKKQRFTKGLFKSAEIYCRAPDSQNMR